MCYQISHPASSAPSPSLTKSIYIAVPGRDDKKAEIYQFPEEKLICVVPKIETSETGEYVQLIAQCVQLHFLGGDFNDTQSSSGTE